MMMFVGVCLGGGEKRGGMFVILVFSPSDSFLSITFEQFRVVPLFCFNPFAPTPMDYKVSPLLLIDNFPSTNSSFREGDE